MPPPRKPGTHTQTYDMPTIRMSSSARRPGTSSSRRWALIGAYLLGLYTWWVLCGFYFGIGEAGPAAVQPEADPSLECHRMRVAYEVTPGREWGKLPSALQARWKEIRCDEHEKEAAHGAALHPEEGTAVATPDTSPASRPHMTTLCSRSIKCWIFISMFRCINGR